MLFKSLSLFLLVVSVTSSQLFADLPHAQPAEVNMRADRLSRIDRVVADGLRRGNMPGCVVLIGHEGHIVFENAYGHRQTEPQQVPMTLDTVFDLASLTKPIATATSVMMLIQEGKVAIDDPVSKYLPEFSSHGKDQITVKQLLSHQGGLIPDNALSDYKSGREQSYEKINELSLRAKPGEEFIYSDVGFIVLGELVETISGQRLDAFTQEHFFKPLQMHETGYLPREELKQRAAVTQQRNDAWMQGEVHDPRAYEMDGVAGHAGLFATAQDLARYAQMVLNNGQFDGVRILKPETIQLMTSAVPVSSGIRSPGWDKQTGYSSNKGDLLSDSAIGHGGFTGTGIWIDPDQELFIIFLSNRVHPDGKGSVNSLIGRVATLAAAAIEK